MCIAFWLCKLLDQNKNNVYFVHCPSMPLQAWSWSHLFDKITFIWRVFIILHMLCGVKVKCDALRRYGGQLPRGRATGLRPPPTPVLRLQLEPDPDQGQPHRVYSHTSSPSTQIMCYKLGSIWYQVELLCEHLFCPWLYDFRRKLNFVWRRKFNILCNLCNLGENLGDAI